MSYTRSFQGQAHYDGYVRVSYPASEHGGTTTEYYSGSIPIQINVSVDTDRFDSSVNMTALSLASVATGVTGMKQKQCKAIEESGKLISKAAIDGFYTLIGSELSQQINENLNKINANMALMLEQSRSIENIHGRMNKDFNMIKSRYTKLFTELDNECQKRIYELDKSVFKLSQEINKKVIVDPYMNSSALAYAHMTEDAATHLKMAFARIRKMTKNVIDGFLKSSMNELAYEREVENFSFSQVHDKETFYMPFISVSTTEGQEMYFTDNEKGKIAREEISRMSADEKESLYEKPTQEEEDMIRKYFLSNAEAFIGDDAANEEKLRVYKTLMNLWETK